MFLNDLYIFFEQMPHVWLIAFSGQIQRQCQNKVPIHLEINRFFVQFNCEQFVIVQCVISAKNFICECNLKQFSTFKDTAIV